MALPLSDIAVGQPHVAAHNNERHEINALGSALSAKANTSDVLAAKSNDFTLDADEFFATFTIADDGSDTNLWPQRMEFFFTPVGGVPNHTSYWNEYGELRVAPAKHNTTAFRLFTREFPTQSAHDADVPIMDVMDNRTNRNIIFSLFPDGSVKCTNIEDKVVTVPTGTSGFATQPDGTLWVEYTP